MKKKSELFCEQMARMPDRSAKMDRTGQHFPIQSMVAAGRLSSEFVAVV
jgi:hypothetical protein